MNETPILRPLLICEKLIFERDSNNVSLINCHTVRWADRFPTQPMQFAIHGLLTNGYGKLMMELRISRLDTLATIFEQEFEMTFLDRLRDSNFASRINDLVFPKEGPYQIDLLANGELVGMATLHLRKRGQK
jgi:hypothetical protein